MQQEAKVQEGSARRDNSAIPPGLAYPPALGDKPRGVSARQNGALRPIHLRKLRHRGDSGAADRPERPAHAAQKQ